MIRILFVDDEPRVLDGLRQSLRLKRKVWDMVFAEGGQRALVELERGAFDIIVSDMRMPGMDGAELLSRAAALQPQAARLVLSGQMDASSGARVATVAHRFLTKPCDPETLEKTLTRTVELRALLASEEVRRCIGGAATLPSLPRACAALNEAVADERVEMENIARIIEKDVAMASKVLKLVNSSFFGLPRQVASIAQAVSYLGLNTIRNLVVAESMFQAFTGSDLQEFEREQSAALLAARIARRLLSDKRQADAASAAALLHHVGILALASRLPHEHRERVELARARRVPLHVVEREQLGTTHAEIGAYLLGLWGLPHDVIEAVANHHAPWSTVATLDVGAAVRFGDALSCSLFLGFEDAELHGEPAPTELLDRFGIVATLTRLSQELRPSIPYYPKATA